MEIKDRGSLVYSSQLCYCLYPGHDERRQVEAHMHADSASKGEVTGSVIAGQTSTFSASGVIPTAVVPIEDQASSIIFCRIMIGPYFSTRSGLHSC